MYDARSLSLVRVLPTDAPVTSLEVTFDQAHVCTAEGRFVRVFDAANLTQLNAYNVPHMAESASYCHAKRRFVAGGEDLWVYFYDADTGQVSE